LGWLDRDRQLADLAGEGEGTW
jgi:hypothetical protein